MEPKESIYTHLAPRQNHNIKFSARSAQFFADIFAQISHPRHGNDLPRRFWHARFYSNEMFSKKDIHLGENPIEREEKRTTTTITLGVTDW